MVEKKELPEPPTAIATLGDLQDIDRTVESLKMEVSTIDYPLTFLIVQFLMRLQSQDYISANQI